MHRVNIWSSPRNISTALMYSFAQRPDTRVVDEPLYAHYLLESGKTHPGRAEIIDEMENSGLRVVTQMLSDDWGSTVVLFKQMTHHLIGLDRDFLNRMENIILIRNPEEIIFSYSKVIPKVFMEDIGIKMQYDLYQHLLEANKLCAVVDVKNLLMDPEGVLTGLCEAVGIPFYKEMLSWEAGARTEDGVWAKYWYENVHKSTGFQPYKAKDIELNQELKALALECQKYYDFLLNKSIKAR